MAAAAGEMGERPDTGREGGLCGAGGPGVGPLEPPWIDVFVEWLKTNKQSIVII